MNFRCELCHKTFPADPDTMLEVETGTLVSNDQEIPAEIQVLAGDHDPELPSSYGICICKECQRTLKLENRHEASKV